VAEVDDLVDDFVPQILRLFLLPLLLLLFAKHQLHVTWHGTSFFFAGAHQT